MTETESITSSEEDTDKETKTSVTDSWDWEDSEDNFFADDGKENDKRESTTLRAKHVFLHLNEFEIKPEEKKWFQMCENYHNELLQKETININEFVGLDLFDESLINYWQLRQRPPTPKKKPVMAPTLTKKTSSSRFSFKSVRVINY